ncbi:MAG TPA: M20/M25/M40 family metallo-hydrolase [Kofleriaceae bacterium]
MTSSERGDGDSQLRWISIGADALDNARALASIESFEIAGDLALVHIAEHDLASLSRVMHEQHHRCGGFIVHDTHEDARRALAAAPRDRTAHFAVPYTIDNAAVVNRLLPALTESSLLSMIRELSERFPSRYHSSAGGLAVPAWLRDQWAGYAMGRPDVTVELFAHEGFQQRSVIATITGTTKPDEVIVIGGHIDSIASGSSSAPGADDDASGIATISEVLRVLMAKKFKPERTVKLMAYAAEEIGLRGSRSIVADFVAKDINVVGVMQLDMTNYKGSAKDIYLMSDFTNAAQNTFLGTLIDTYVGATWGTSQCGYGCSDHASWHNEGFAASMPAEGRFEDTNPTIHSPDDTLDVSNNTATHALKFARLATSYVAELAKGELLNGAPVVSITAPGADETRPASAPVELVATAIDEEDGELSASIEWSSNLDGVLGSGALLSTKLSVGVHVITATARDSAGAAGDATTSLTISIDGEDDGSGTGGGCDTGGNGGLAAAFASLLVCLARRRRRSVTTPRCGTRSSHSR